ncbi:glutaredoxin family protein [Glaciimonas sp. Gout2]|uniref:glutaredoxin family protein n=1 Tax=unclassified Glaciimonas TaxID=2644401 RepID=UPI002AB378FA|nr:MULTISPECIES: glutaredoxin family protein [unclassified Glaciimonas]MDY7546863.1 glutaredoxin family protein [Glaciimonas sp. CA11.2]MEB0012332.1 glutaredoxin family protein [Glaciimonas sp. Cout2]MEB0080482.1 glutaredoxin family protein [Glaciimonas sp. Gout2]
MKLVASLFSTAGLAVCLLATSVAQAQLYKSIGADGRVTYSDIPPNSGKIVDSKSLSKNSESDIDNSDLPYELAQAKKNSPVTLYTSSKCIPCDDGRKLLRNRGIPFREKTISTNNDIARLKEVAGESQLPFMVIGRNKESGFEATSWNAALSAAGYPQNNRLPKTYQNGQATAAAPTVNTSTASPAIDDSTDNSKQGTPRPATGNTPPGFRF